jgi:hypothetical protein
VGTRARPALDGVPGLAAELRQRGACPSAPDVARDLPDLLVRDVEAVVALEAEEEVVARDPGDGLRLEAEELPDAVILVDDVVARCEVGEALQRAADARIGARRALRKICVSGRGRGPRSREDEAAPRRRDGEEEAFLIGSLSPGSSTSGSMRRQKAFVCSASPRCANVTTTRLPGAHEREEVALGLGEPARRDRGSLRLEGVALPGRSWLSSVAPPRPS